MTNILHALIMTLPGISVTYNGDEIGMVNHMGITWNETVDPQACNFGTPENYLGRSRDITRTPFQWDDSPFAGFTDPDTEKTWLPVNPDYKKRNLKKQKEDEESVYKFYQQLSKLRKDPILMEGSFKSKNYGPNVLAVER